MPNDSFDPHRIIIVDGYATGDALVRKLLDRNVECLHLRSMKEVPAEATAGFDPSPYDADLGYIGDASDAIELVAELKPLAVLAGSAWGTGLADEITRALLPSADGPRRNTFQTLEAVRRYGLRTAEQAIIRSVDHAHNWAIWYNQWPIVLKPLDNITSASVAICRNHDDIERACARLLRREISPGYYSDSLIVQAWLCGPQYVLNTVSLDGRHHVTDAWHKEFAGNNNNTPWAVRALHLLDPSLPAAAAATAYTFNVLRALGVSHGAAHSELKITPEGPALISTSTRLMEAATDQTAYHHAGMNTQASAFAAVLVGTASEHDSLFAAPHFTFHRHLSKVFFVFDRDGEVESAEGLERLKSLMSFHSHYHPLKPGSRVLRSTGPLSCGGTVYLIHDERSQIEEDIRRFVAWEREGLLYKWQAR